MNQLTLREAALEWARGKKVQAAPSNHPDDWSGIDGVGEESCSNRHTANIFNIPNSRYYIFRLAPEPPPKKFRPWNPEEVPLGAQIRAIGLIWRGLILAVRANGEIQCMPGFIPLEYAFENHEHSTDNGRTWKPCGVEVES